MENRRNYYRILHVQPDAPAEIIRTSYRTLMQQLRAHPDLGGDHWNATLINEAYAVLTDPVRRAAYDREMQARNGPNPWQSITLPAPKPALPGRTAAGPETAGRTRTCEFCGRTNPLHDPQSEAAICASCGSPLQPALHRHFETAGKRAIGRLDRTYPVRLWTAWPDGGPFEGVTQDVSLNGMQILTPLAAAAGVVVKLECELCSALIRVIAADPAGLAREGLWRMRAEFLTVRFRHAQGGFLSVRA